MPGGAPSKYSAEIVEQVSELALCGKTDEEIAAEIGVSRSTLALWKVRHPEFSDALTSWKADADEQIVHSLYRKALSGDTTAQIFWLKNRKRHEWRDKHDVEHGVTSQLGDILSRIDGRTRNITPVYELVAVDRTEDSV